VQQLLSNVYDIKIPRTSVEQFYADWISKFNAAQYLSEGDLVFFRIDPTRSVSHVGLYLSNRMFINSSSSRGVSIANLDDPYWRSVYVGAGRINPQLIGARKK
jgi:murein DD-endopeptidase / murein LD-carboxypeptidase